MFLELQDCEKMICKIMLHNTIENCIQDYYLLKENYDNLYHLFNPNLKEETSNFIYLTNYQLMLSHTHLTLEVLLNKFNFFSNNFENIECLKYMTEISELQCIILNTLNEIIDKKNL